MASSSSSTIPPGKSEPEMEKSEECGKDSEQVELTERQVLPDGEKTVEIVESLTTNESNDASIPSTKPEVEMENSGGYGIESGHAELVKKQILSDGQKPLKSLTLTNQYGTGPRTTSQTSSSCSSSSSPSPSPVPKRKSSVDHNDGPSPNQRSKSSERNKFSFHQDKHSNSSVRRRSSPHEDRQSKSSDRYRSNPGHHSKSSDRKRSSPHQSRHSKPKSSDRHRSSSHRNERQRSPPRTSRSESHKSTQSNHSQSRRSRSPGHSRSKVSNSHRQSWSPDGSHSHRGHSSSHRKSSRYSHHDSESRSYRNESRSSRGRRRSRSNEQDRQRRRWSRSRSSNRRYPQERDYIPPDSSHSSRTHRELYSNAASTTTRYDYFNMGRPESGRRTLSEERRNWEDYHGVYVKPHSQEIPTEEYWGECSSTTTLAKDTSYNTMRVLDCTDSGAQQSKVVDSSYPMQIPKHSQKKNVSPDTTSASVHDAVPNFSCETVQSSTVSGELAIQIPRSSKASSDHEPEPGALSDTHSSSSSTSTSTSSGKKKKKSKKTKKGKRDESKKSHSRKSSRSEKETKKSKKRSAREARRNERLRKQKSIATTKPLVVPTPSLAKAPTKEKSKTKQKPAAVDDTMLEGLRKSLKPMSYEDYQKQQSVVRRVFDPESGRNRLVRGDGEILEEIVSKSRHQQINRAATAADGAQFQATLASKK